MREATKSDSDLLIKILLESFEENPRVNWILGEKGNLLKKRRLIIQYSVEKALREGFAFLSETLRHQDCMFGVAMLSEVADL